MPDVMDHVQEYNDARNDDAVRAHAQRPHLPPRAHCANLDCGEPIAPERQALHAQLCLMCQKAEEASRVHLRHWRQGRGR